MQDQILKSFHEKFPDSGKSVEVRLDPSEGKSQNVSVENARIF
jgi:hypothetical protein